MNQEWFNDYKELKEKFNYTYKGYNLKYLVAGYLNLNFDEKPILRDVFKEYYLSTTIIDLRKALSIEQQTLITYLINRTDYRDLANTAQQYYPDSAVIDLSSLPIKKISPISITYCKHFWMAVWLIFRRGIGHNFNYKLQFMALVIKLLNQIKLIEKYPNPVHIKRYICFNSAYKEETLLTLYFNKRNIETVTLQHGIFCNFKRLIPFDIINYENCVAQNMLNWGQSSIDFLTEKGFDRSRLNPIGNLKYKDFKIEKISQTFTKCLVLLGRPLYIETNDKLLDTLAEYNKKHDNEIVFYIKKHPFIEDKYHVQHADIAHNIIFMGREHSVQEILKSDIVDFSIAVNTTAYYESLALGKPCLRWTEEENEDFYGMDDKFENLSQLEEKIDLLKNMEQDRLVKDVKDLIRYIFNPNLL